MPRKDRTFSDKDIIRIVRSNLLPDEQKAVIIKLCEGLVIEEIKGEAVIVPMSSLKDALEEAGIIQVVIDIVLAIVLKI